MDPYPIAFGVALIAGVLFYESRQPDPSGIPWVPSLLPWIGSAPRYILGPTAFLKACRQKYGPAYKFVLGGRTVIILSTPETISSFYRQPGLGNEFVVSKIYKALAGLDNGGYLYELTYRKLFPLITEYLAPHRLDQISTQFTEELFPRVDNVSTGMFIHLSDFSGRHLYDATNAVLFGPHFPKGTYTDFFTLDVEAPNLINNFPFTVQKGLTARRRLLDGIQTFVAEGWTDVGDGKIRGASSMISRMVRQLKDAETTDGDIAGLLLSFLWAVHGTTLRVSFWLIAHLLARPDVMHEVCTEIRSSPTISLHSLSTLGATQPRVLLGPEFPILDSVLKETIRLVALSTSMREAEMDVQITGDGMTYAVKKGELVMGDVRAIHQDPDMFPEPETFQHDRFMDDHTEGGRLNNPAALLAWGGGAHMCKGRHFATYAIKLFLAKTLEEYDIRPLPTFASGIRVPSTDPRSIGVTRTAEDILIRLQRRSGSQ
ncbi:cytochrome P450 [Mycena polygramma]|nr:cytochrome P450 [Mycena polygramma]